jgi:hypothetical protein
VTIIAQHKSASDANSVTQLVRDLSAALEPTVIESSEHVSLVQYDDVFATSLLDRYASIRCVSCAQSCSVYVTNHSLDLTSKGDRVHQIVIVLADGG